MGMIAHVMVNLVVGCRNGRYDGRKLMRREEAWTLQLWRLKLRSLPMVIRTVAPAVKEQARKREMLPRDRSRSETGKPGQALGCTQMDLSPQTARSLSFL